jgi:hypothetical protein
MVLTRSAQAIFVHNGRPLNSDSQLKKERTMNIRVLLTLAVFVVMVAVSAGTASATPVALVNSLMQDPSPTVAWDPSNPVPWDSVPNGSYTTYPTGWVTVFGDGEGNPNGTNDIIQERHPASSEFAVSSGNNPLPSPTGITMITFSTQTIQNAVYGGSFPAPASGSQALYNSSTADNDIAILDDTAGTNGLPAQPTILLQKNTQYTLTMSIGQALTPPNPNDSGFGGFSLLVADVTTGGDLVGQEYHGTAEDNPTAGTFYDYSVTFNGNDFITGKKGAPKAGDTMRVGLDLGVNSYVTDIRLDDTPGGSAPVLPTVPEPSTMVLLASGLIGLLAYAWRKRK